MENIINFKTFSSINESVDPNATNIIIGDSLCPLLAAKITNASLLSRDSGEKSLWKGGMGVSWLKDAVSKYRISPNIQNVVVNIGTNGGFKLKDDIKGLTLIPISLYSKGRYIKVSIAVARGKKVFDKRETIKKRDVDREIRRTLKTR